MADDIDFTTNSEYLVPSTSARERMELSLKSGI